MQLWKPVQNEGREFVIFALFGRYYITKRTRRFAANLVMYAAFLVTKIISIDHFLFLIISSSHSMLIKSEKLEFIPKFA